MVTVATLEWQDVMTGTFPESRPPGLSRGRGHRGRTRQGGPARNHGRIEKAVKLGVGGDVEMLEGGSAEVGSASDAGQVFQVTELLVWRLPKSPRRPM